MTVFQLLAVLFLEMEQDDFANNPRTARPAENLKTVPKKICWALQGIMKEKNMFPHHVRIRVTIVFHPGEAMEVRHCDT